MGPGSSVEGVPLLEIGWRNEGEGQGQGPAAVVGIQLEGR